MLTAKKTVAELRQYWESKQTNPENQASKTAETLNCNVTKCVTENIVVHVINLHCSCCDSSLYLRAAHSCTQDHNERGLEWLENTDVGNDTAINIIV
jgi:hypothetical protein